ncbi:MAG TPA: phage baseplate assembly protein V, partial [Thermoanaerobaculia bacterium]
MSAINAGKKFYGIYRATVINNIDPMQIGRIQVICPDVSNIIPTSWAMPCVPIAGKQSG